MAQAIWNCVELDISTNELAAGLPDWQTYHLELVKTFPPPLTLNTGLLGDVCLFPFYFPHTHGCVTKYNTNPISKFADDTTVVSQINKN